MGRLKGNVVWLCRCREKQRKEASRLQTVNRKLSAMNKLLMEENDRLQKQVSQLVCENGYMRQQLHTVSIYDCSLLNCFLHLFPSSGPFPLYTILSRFKKQNVSSSEVNFFDLMIRSGYL